MHRTITRLYPYMIGKSVEVISDKQITVKKAMDAVCENDRYADQNRNSKNFSYLLGEKGVYEFERLY
nr:MAG TPA: hypothetical protein [Bacteriophage sp.]